MTCGLRKRTQISVTDKEGTLTCFLSVITATASSSLTFSNGLLIHHLDSFGTQLRQRGLGAPLTPSVKITQQDEHTDRYQCVCVCVTFASDP